MTGSHAAILTLYKKTYENTCLIDGVFAQVVARSPDLAAPLTNGLRSRPEGETCGQTGGGVGRPTPNGCKREGSAGGPKIQCGLRWPFRVLPEEGQQMPENSSISRGKRGAKWIMTKKRSRSCIVLNRVLRLAPWLEARQRWNEDTASH